MADDDLNLPEETEGLPLEHPRAQAHLNKARQFIRTARVYSCEVYRKAGKELLGAKIIVDRGGWLRFLKEDKEFSRQTAENYMKLSL